MDHDDLDLFPRPQPGEAFFNLSIGQPDRDYDYDDDDDNNDDDDQENYDASETDVAPGGVIYRAP